VEMEDISEQQTKQYLREKEEEEFNQQQFK
jgi:hypothetical protein